MLRKILPFLLLQSHLVFSQTDNVGSGRAIQFDGVDDFIDLGNIYDNVALPVTMSAWVYIDEATALVHFPYSIARMARRTYNGFTIITSTNPHIGVAYGDGLGGKNPAYRAAKAGFFQRLKGRWVHITGIIRGAGNMNVYLNGHDIGGTYEGGSASPMSSSSPGRSGSSNRRCLFYVLST